MLDPGSVTGIVLAGGNSSRMGHDKGLRAFNGRPLVEYGLEALQKACGTILISTNDNTYAQFGFPLVTDLVSGIGPIGGIYSSLSASTTRHNLVISCDMPLLQPEIFGALLEDPGSFDAVVPVSGGKCEPLCAYYNRDARQAFHEFIRGGRFKMQDLLQSLHTRWLDIETDHPHLSGDMFLNLNTPMDLQALEAMILKKNRHPGGPAS